MSATSKKSSAAIDRPFTADLLRKARAIAQSYQIVLHQEDGEYYGRAVEMPNVMNDGATPDQCVKATRDMLTTVRRLPFAGERTGDFAPRRNKANRTNQRAGDRRRKTNSGRSRPRMRAGYQAYPTLSAASAIQSLH